MQNGARTHGPASLRVDDCRALPKSMRPQTREITALQTPADAQQKGHASALMRAVCVEADSADITLILFPQPFGEDIALSGGQLIEWYTRRFGFQQIQAEPPMLARMPGSTPRVLSAKGAGVAHG